MISTALVLISAAMSMQASDTTRAARETFTHCLRVSLTAAPTTTRRSTSSTPLSRKPAPPSRQPSARRSSSATWQRGRLVRPPRIRPISRSGTRDPISTTYSRCRYRRSRSRMRLPRRPPPRRPSRRLRRNPPRRQAGGAAGCAAALGTSSAADIMAMVGASAVAGAFRVTCDARKTGATSARLSLFRQMPAQILQWLQRKGCREKAAEKRRRDGALRAGPDATARTPQAGCYSAAVCSIW